MNSHDRVSGTHTLSYRRRMPQMRTASLWTVQFDTPYTISVPDGLEDPDLRAWAEASDQGQQPMPVSYSPRFVGSSIGGAIHLPPHPDQLAAHFDVIYGSDRLATVGCLRRVRNVDAPIVMGGELRPCRGLSQFSTVLVRLDRETSQGIGDMNDAVEHAIQAYSRFIELFRAVTGAYWLYPLEVGHLPWALVSTYYDDGTSAINRVTSRPAGGPLHIGATSMLDDEKESDLRWLLKRPDAAGFVPNTLLQNAKAHRFDGRYESCIVDVAAAVEAYVSDFVRGEAMAAGFSKDRSNLLLRHENGSYKSVRLVLKDVLREPPFEIDIGGTAEFRDWDQSVRIQRNGLLHGQLSSVSRLEADAALAAADRLVAKLATRRRPE